MSSTVLLSLRQPGFVGGSAHRDLAAVFPVPFGVPSWSSESRDLGAVTGDCSSGWPSKDRIADSPNPKSSMFLSVSDQGTGTNGGHR